jgi:hypothetical protein
LSVEILPLLGLFRLREEAPGIAIGYGLMAPFALTLIGLYSSIFPLIFLYIGLLEVTLILGLLSQRHFRLQTEARMQHTHVFTKETYYAGVAIQVIRLILVAIGTIAVYFANEVWSVIYGQNALIMVGVNVICVAGLVLRKEWGYYSSCISCNLRFYQRRDSNNISFLIRKLAVRWSRVQITSGPPLLLSSL